MNPRAVIILGGGPAGLAAAHALANRGFEVDVAEMRSRVGGNAASFELAGQRVDLGSHRLHPSCHPEILALLRNLLGDELRRRPRHGRIRLRGRWIHFPLRPVDLALRLPPRFAVGVLADLLVGSRRSRVPASSSFATVLEERLGRTLCHEFYFPYARKIWGLEPHEIAPEQAYRRVSATSLLDVVRRLLPLSRSGPGRGARHFYYPAGGFGRIAEALGAAAVRAGARIHLEAPAEAVRRRPEGGFEVLLGGAARRRLVAAHVWSTVPMPELVRRLVPPPPESVARAATRLEMRSMVLVYLVVGRACYSAFDAHYFPEDTVPITRLSEPKHYAGTSEPADRTVLCAELPCAAEDSHWQLADEALALLVREALGAAGLPPVTPLLEVAVRRLRHAYPIYRRGYEPAFDALDRWLSGLEGLLSFGRQGLFVHDNTHHTLYMAHAAADCLSDTGTFDRDRWQAYRERFEAHVVED